MSDNAQTSQGTKGKKPNSADRAEQRKAQQEERKQFKLRMVEDPDSVVFRAVSIEGRVAAAVLSQLDPMLNRLHTTSNVTFLRTVSPEKAGSLIQRTSTVIEELHAIAQEAAELTNFKYRPPRALRNDEEEVDKQAQNQPVAAGKEIPATSSISG